MSKVMYLVHIPDTAHSNSLSLSFHFEDTLYTMGNQEDRLYELALLLG